MSLDFVVLGQNGAPENTVPLGVELHHELVAVASVYGLSRFKKFANYYEDVTVAVYDLSGLAEEVQTLRNTTTSSDLRRFLDELNDLISYAIDKKKELHAIAD